MALQPVRQPNDEPTSLQILFSDPRRAVQENCIVCLICAAQLRQLTNTHLRAHGTGAAEYRARFGYNRRRALMCRALRRLYTERAVRAGLASRIRHRPIVETPELRRLGGVRSITLEEQLTRREAHRQALAARLTIDGGA
jgi:predicted transcriptional regulator